MIINRVLTLLYFTMYSKIGAPPSSCLVILSLKLFPLLGCPCMDGGLGSPNKQQNILTCTHFIDVEILHFNKKIHITKCITSSCFYHFLFFLCCDITFGPLFIHPRKATFTNLEVSCQNCEISESYIPFILMGKCSKNRTYCIIQALSFISCIDSII